MVSPQTSALNLTSRSLEKRFDNARFTFYDAGLGACGKTNTGADFIVAVNPVQYAGGAHCFETITITAMGKSHTAQIVDLCPGCPDGGLDFSRSLFSFFAPQSVGVLTGQWNFGSGGGGGNSGGGGGTGGGASSGGNNPAASNPNPPPSKPKPKPKPKPSPQAVPAPAPSTTSAPPTAVINHALATPSVSSSLSSPTSGNSTDGASLASDLIASLDQAFLSLAGLSLAAASQ